MNRHDIALKILHEGTCIPASPLALNKERKFDENRQRALSRYYLDSGVGGLAIAVHTTQFEIRDNKINLFETVLKCASDEISKYEESSGKTIVKISGVCGETEQAIKEAELAKSYGYDAVLLSPGGLSHLSENELILRTKKVAETIPIIAFYLQPACGGRVFSYNYWEQICEIDGVAAIKAASFDRYLTQDVVRAVTFSKRADKIALYTGNDDNIVMDLLANYEFFKDGKSYKNGFVGGLLGHWSVWTKTAVNMFEMLKKAKKTENITDEIMALANKVTDANSAFFDTANNFEGCIAGLHEVLRRQGLLEGIWCLNPKETLSLGQSEEIDRVYKMYPELNDDEFVKENIEKWLNHECI
ncbi:MAG: dihydrodipicolinate synthase family protein [Oscillospiraceae bacterium]